MREIIWNTPDGGTVIAPQVYEAINGPTVGGSPRDPFEGHIPQPPPMWPICL